MTTLSPRSPYTSDELRQLYPETLALQQVQVVSLLITIEDTASDPLEAITAWCVYVMSP